MDKVRSEFEAWAKRQLWDTEWGEIEYGACGYLSDLTQGAWLLWQDKAALTSREGEAVAWMTEDGERCVTERTMAGARKDGGAILSSLSAFTVPLTYAAPSARVAELEARIATLESQLAASRERFALAYGLLWHVNAGIDAPWGTPSMTPERAAMESRKLLRDMLTHEQRGDGINAARDIMKALAADQEKK